MRKLMIVTLLSVVTISAQKIMKLTTPPYLKKGDTIAIVAPAGILKNRKQVIADAKALVEGWGLKVLVGKHVFSQANHFAGTDEQRCHDFQKALDNPNVKAIWSARGGYGSVRILDQLNFSKFKEHPKWIIGYSDITAFHNHVHNLGVESLHAMMGTSMEDQPEELTETIETFRKALFEEPLGYTIKSSKYNRKGTAEGILVGGNIAILASMLGSDSQIDTDGKVLFIEEIGEYKYAIDRMLQSLKRAGYFTKVRGVIVGDMTKIRKNTTPWGSSIEQLILDIIPNNIPVMFCFPAGHEPDNRALIMGREVNLSVGNKLSSVSFK